MIATGETIFWLIYSKLMSLDCPWEDLVLGLDDCGHVPGVVLPVRL